MALNKSTRIVTKRKRANDVFITPLSLAKKHIDMIPYKHGCWYDPFRNSGSYYNQFPDTASKEWSEIIDGHDFFQFNKKVDIICSNPPFSILNKILEKSVSLQPIVISYLIGVHNLTPKRMEFMEKHGYFITKIHMFKVYKWFGMSCIVVWEKNKPSVLTYDRIVWRES